MQSIRIHSTQISSYQKNFIRPFVMAGGVVSQRQGMLLSLSSSSFKSLGEIAPLEGYSSETIKKARHDLQEIVPLLQDLEIPADAKQLIQFLSAFKSLSQQCPSVRFGVESAILDLVSQHQAVSLGQFLGAKLRQLPSAVLLQGPAHLILQEAKEQLEFGEKVFKLKVGNRNVALDVKNVKDLRGILPSEACIRLDANRSWSMSEAVLFAQLIGTDQVEFIEEPLADMSKLGEFYEKTHLPVALDETLSMMRCGVMAPGRCTPGLDRHEAVAAYILKPTILGGIIHCLSWINQANELGKKAIISSTFESSIGLRILRELALCTGQVSGLGTGRWLSE